MYWRVMVGTCTLHNVTPVLAEYDNNASRMKNDDNSLEGLRKGFLLEMKVNDRRKKIYEDNESVDSSDEASELYGLSEYDLDMYDNDIEVKSDDSDSGYLYNKEYITDEDYGFE